MELDKRLSMLMLVCALCSPLSAGKGSKVKTVRRTPYQQIISHIHHLGEPKFNLVRDLIIRNFAKHNELPELTKIKKVTVTPSPRDEIKIEALGKNKEKISIRVLGKIIKMRIQSVQTPKIVENEIKIKQPNFIASKLFIKQFKEHLHGIENACTLLDLSAVLDETEELKDSINDYYSFLVPDTEGSLFPELNENPKALNLLFSLKKVQRNAILKLMVLTKISSKC